jgi:hypothetical protein
MMGNWVDDDQDNLYDSLVPLGRWYLHRNSNVLVMPTHLPAYDWPRQSHANNAATMIEREPVWPAESKMHCPAFIPRMLKRFS